MAPIKLLHSCLNCFNWRDTLSYLYKKICLLVGLSEPGPAENKPFQAPLSESAFSARTLEVTSVSVFAEQRAAEQKPRSPRGQALLAPREGPPLAAKFLSPAWEQFGRVWSDSGRRILAGAGLGDDFRAVLGEGTGCWQLVGGAYRTSVQREADFFSVTRGEEPLGDVKEPACRAGQ